MATLFDATLRLAGKLGEVIRSTATGGTTTTLVDAALSAPVDWFKGGSLWLLSGTYAGKFREVSAFAAGATFTWITPLAGAVVAGVKYAAAPKNVPLWALIQATNDAMNDAGGLGQTDDTLDVVAGQEEYTLPTGVSHVAQVWLAMAAIAPFGWVPHYHWREVPGGKIRFDTGHEPSMVGYPIRINWNGPALPLALDSDAIDGTFDPKRLLWESVLSALKMSYIREITDEKKAAKLIADAKDELSKCVPYSIAVWETTPHFAG
jgi:hypothetical protein